AIFVHPLVKNFDIARSKGQYRDFCPLSGQKLRYCPIQGAISTFLCTSCANFPILPDLRGNIDFLHTFEVTVRSEILSSITLLGTLTRPDILAISTHS
ncbi:MAG: hypothetical protein QM296_05665, partial [Bacillota bacterium]|nr:hypothetical protein [Bacillota bacterium]